MDSNINYDPVCIVILPGSSPYQEAVSLGIRIWIEGGSFEEGCIEKHIAMFLLAIRLYHTQHQIQTMNPKTLNHV